jgi:hypothetical protein
MADKTVADKLLIKPGATVWVSDETRRGLLGPLPPSVGAAADPGSASTLVVFANDAAAVRKAFDADRGAFAASSNLWIAYPKGNKADINRDTLWPIGAEYGFRPISQVAIDDTWSALRFRILREGEAPFTGGR